jgi:hypothetical protein
LSPGKVKNFNFTIPSTPALMFTKTAFQWVKGDLCHEVKRRGGGGEPYHLPGTSAEIKGGYPCHHGMARPRVADGRDGLQLEVSCEYIE